MQFFFLQKEGKTSHWVRPTYFNVTTKLTTHWGSHQAPQTTHGETQKGGQDCKNKAKPKIHLGAWNESYPHFHCGNFNQQPYTGRTYNLNLVLVFFFPPENAVVQ